MLRRLFFLFPDEKHAQNMVDELLNMNIPERRMHAISHAKKLTTLLEATEYKKNNAGFRVEWFLWNANLAIFVVAAASLITTILTGALFLSIFSLLVMLATFMAGQQFAMRIPVVHLTEFTDALAHGEILLMIDVPVYRLAEIEDYVHLHHPVATVAGASWTMDVFGN